MTDGRLADVSVPNSKISGCLVVACVRAVCLPEGQASISLVTTPGPVRSPITAAGGDDGRPEIVKNPFEGIPLIRKESE